MSQKKSFWGSLPGLITAIGGTITAIAGLITALYTVGVIPHLEQNGQDADTKIVEHIETQDNRKSSESRNLDRTEPPSSSTTSDSSKTITPSTDTITLLPDIRDMGKLGGGGVSGSLIKGSNQPFSPPSFGDRGDGKEHRGFISFALHELSTDEKIASAKLFTAKGGRSGDLNQRYFKNVIIEDVNIGHALDQKDFSRPGILLKNINISDLTRQPLDVMDAVKRAQRNDKKFITFRFRFSVGNDNDEESDSWAFSYSRGKTRLEVKVYR